MIGSRAASVEKVIRDGENGLLGDFFSPPEVTERVVATLADPGRFAEPRTRARRTIVEAYDLKRFCLPAQVKLIAQLRRSVGCSIECATVRSNQLPANWWSKLRMPGLGTEHSFAGEGTGSYVGLPPQQRQPAGHRPFN